MPTVVARTDGFEFKALELGTDLQRITHRLYSNRFQAADLKEEQRRPADAYYFPLDGNKLGYAANSAVRNLQAELSDNNYIQDSEGAWVGTANVNLWPAKTGLKGWQTGTAGLVPPLDNSYIDITSATDTLTANNYIAISANQPYTVSAYFRSTAINPTVKPMHFRLVRSTGASELARAGEIVTIPNGLWERWQRAYGSATYTEATSTAFPYIASPAGARYCGMMLENRPFVSAWVADSNAGGLLRFNLHNSIGLNWNEDYTIMYWKKMHGTNSNGTSNGYNVDSLGRNSNTVGGGFRWWGKYTDLTWGFISGIRTAFNLSDLQYKWVLIVLRRSGSTQTLKLYSKNYLYSQTMDDSSAVTANRYVTQNGYDLQLGGWDNGNPCNAYYRDLIILKRALTDFELDSYFNTKLKLEEHAMYANSLLEGI